MPLTASFSNRSVARRGIWHLILLLHRYFGIALSLMVLVWCLSGFVMMYVQYPAMSRTEQLAALNDVTLDGCCENRPAAIDLPLLVDGFVVETMGGRTVVRMSLTSGERVAIDAVSGARIDDISDAAALEVARTFARHLGTADSTDRIVALGAIERDQWTVQSQFIAHRPLHHFRDQARNEWYVSGRTGEVVQATTANERLWNWLGAVTHWLYPTVLRQHTEAWSQTVIWLSIGGLFLTITGIAIGIKHLRIKRVGARSPFNGWTLWHHYAGLVFGLLTLTWLLSGLLSMNPWGAFESRNFARETAALRGRPVTLDKVWSYLRDMRRLPASTVRIEAAPLFGEMFFVAWQRDGGAVRIDAASGSPRTLGPGDLGVAVNTIRPGATATTEWLTEEDAYYYHHHQARELPVLRIVYDDAVRYYLSGTTGQLVHFVDANRRWHRWLFQGLHRGDLSAILRSRPLWDILMLLLLAGVTAGASTGIYLAWRRLTTPD